MYLYFAVKKVLYLFTFVCFYSQLRSLICCSLSLFINLGFVLYLLFIYLLSICLFIYSFAHLFVCFIYLFLYLFVCWLVGWFVHCFFIFLNWFFDINVFSSFLFLQRPFDKDVVELVEARKAKARRPMLNNSLWADFTISPTICLSTNASIHIPSIYFA